MLFQSAKCNLLAADEQKAPKLVVFVNNLRLFCRGPFEHRCPGCDLGPCAGQPAALGAPAAAALGPAAQEVRILGAAFLRAT